MTSLEAIRDEIKLKLTGDLLEFELEDSTLDKVIYSAIRELQRYITTMPTRPEDCGWMLQL